MPISFNSIPADLKIPLFWVEVDPSMAGLPRLGFPALVTGIKTADGDAPADVPIAIGSQAQADAHFGQGSELARMFKAFFANNFSNEVYGLPVAEPSGGNAASADIVITTPPTEGGTIHLYIGGQHVPVNVAASDTATDIAAAMAAAIMEIDDLPVDATAATGTVTITCRWRGVNGNDISLGLNYFGSSGGQTLPLGLAMTLPQFLTGGLGVPTFTNAIAALGEKVYDYVALPYSDASTLLAWETEYGFSDVGRWGWQRQLYGHLFSAKRGTYADLILFGEARNSGLTSIFGIETEAPMPCYEWCAAYAAKAQRALINDPARPLQTLSLEGILAAPLHERWNAVELQGLASNGLATQKTPAGNTPMISRETTTYQLNLYGNPDDAYELVTTLATLSRLIRNQRHAITSKFPRCKLADDGTRFGPGQAIVTPSIVKAELIAEYTIDMFNGLVENMRAFKANLLVERDPNNPNRLNVLYPPDLINQLRIFAVNAQFRLQYDRGLDSQIISGANLGVTGVMPLGGVAA